MFSLGTPKQLILLTLVLVFGALTTVIAATPTPATQIYYGFANDLKTVDVDGVTPAPLHVGAANGNTVVDVDHDPALNWVFWVERSSMDPDMIHYIDLSDDSVATLTSMGDITGIDSDPVNQMLYFAVSYATFDGQVVNTYNRVYRISYAGGDPELVYDAGATTIVYDVAVDPISGQIYVTQFVIDVLASPMYRPTIIVAGLDGSTPQTLLGSSDGLSGIAAMIDVDVINGQLYWTSGQTIQTAATDGTGFTNAYTSAGEPVGVAVDPSTSMLYFSQGLSDGTLQIARVGTDGSNPATLTVIGESLLVSGVSIDSDQKFQEDVSEATVTLGFDAASSSVVESGGSAVDVTLSVSGDAITGTFTAQVNTGGTATAGVDYTVPAEISFDCSATCADGTNLTQTLVTVLDDGTDEGDETAVLTLTNLNGPNLTAGTTEHTLTILEDDAAALIVTSPAPPLTINENGEADLDLQVRLATQPSADVMIGISSSDTSEGTVNMGNLTFTPFNWDIERTVTVIGQDDANFDGDQTFNLTFNVSSTDAVYDVLPNTVLSITTLDDEGISPNLVVNPDSYTATIGETLNIPAVVGVLANDSSSTPLTATLNTSTSQGALNFQGTGAFTYTPGGDASGTDSFTYIANDGIASSGPVTVTITLELPTDRVVRMYPADGQIISNGPEWPRFTFRHQPGVEWYQVWVATAGNTTIIDDWFAASDTSTGASPGDGICNVQGICTIPTDYWLNNDDYVWWMTTWSPSAPDSNSYWTESTFSVNFNPPSGFVNRTNPSSTLPNTLQWAYDPGALWYHIWVGTADYSTEIVMEWYDAPTICADGVTCVLNVSGLTFAPNSYEWWVEVWGPGGTTDWVTNGVYSFSVP